MLKYFKYGLAGVFNNLAYTIKKRIVKGLV